MAAFMFLHVSNYTLMFLPKLTLYPDFRVFIFRNEFWIFFITIFSSNDQSFCRHRFHFYFFHPQIRTLALFWYFLVTRICHFFGAYAFFQWCFLLYQKTAVRRIHTKVATSLKVDVIWSGWWNTEIWDNNVWCSIYIEPAKYPKVPN